MQPIGKHIVIDVVEEEVTTESGLLLSGEDTKQLRYGRGTTVAVGTEVASINAGEDLYYDKRASYTMMIDGSPYTIICQRDVVVVLR